MNIVRLSFALALLACAQFAFANTYKCVVDGVTTFSDKPCAGSRVPAPNLPPVAARSGGFSGQGAASPAPNTVAQHAADWRDRFARLVFAVEMVRRCPLDRVRAEGLEVVLDDEPRGDLTPEHGNAVLLDVGRRADALLSSPQRRSACDAMQASIDEGFRRVVLALAAVPAAPTGATPAEAATPGTSGDNSPSGMLARIVFAGDATERCEHVMHSQINALRAITRAGAPQFKQQVGERQLPSVINSVKAHGATLLLTPSHSDAVCKATLDGIENAYRLLGQAIPPWPAGASGAR